MPQIATTSAENREFARVIETARLPALGAFDFDLAPTTQEAAAIARLMDATFLRKMQFAGRLAAAPGGAWDLTARLGASVGQTCVVSLDPVTTRIDTEVHRLFSPEVRPAGPEIVFADLEDDDIEPLPERLDLGLVAIEALALALPAYPRRPGVDLSALAGAPSPGADLGDETAQPFAALAALRARMQEDP